MFFQPSTHHRRAFLCYLGGEKWVSGTFFTISVVTAKKKSACTFFFVFLRSWHGFCLYGFVSGDRQNLVADAGC